uniref:TBC1 domain family member 2 n=1 Tax=Hippocampus comes TaxID=109280 RepID=A0A3Q2Z6L1_HIPCM
QTSERENMPPMSTRAPSSYFLDTPNFPGSSGEPKLCGFLLKQGGPLRAWKRRWFVYEEKQNQMFYYRTPQDVTPLGRVDLSSAAFTYPLKAETGTFHIETPERTYTLKALTQDLMLYWLQQLQLNRWHHRQGRRTSARPDAAAIAVLVLALAAENFLPLLRSPAGLVGREAAKEAPRGTPRAGLRLLQDDIEAYKTQNRFLNSEIFQLTKLWRKSSEQERSLMVKCAYLEAWRCQAESRYLGVLGKLQEHASLDPEQRQSIRKMAEEALQGQAKNNAAAANGLHDEYGFRIIPDYEAEDVKLLAKIQALEIRSHNLLRQDGRERDLSSRWAQYLAGRSDDDFCPSPELKALLRAGVPPEYRRRVWRCLVRIRTGAARERHRACPHPASRQIRLDLHRTLTGNRNFSSPSSLAHQQLERILSAFSWQNPSVGYCQGLNRLAAIALVVLQSEEEAFWCVVAVVDAIMPQDYYGKNLLAAQADQHVLKDFLVEKLPRLAAHFDLHGIDVSLVTFNWFLVVFVESLPSDILLPLWDAFLYEGTKVQDDILKIHDGVDVYQYLRFFTKTVTDVRKLMGMAFVDMNPFPGRLLKKRRLLHLERLQGELRELEEQQQAFAALALRRPDDQMDNVASEDDEELA